MNEATLPAHHDSGWGQHTFEIACLVTAAALIAHQTWRVTSGGLAICWPLAAAVAGGALFADFLSGVVHWFADTWFEETTPLVGRRLLRPFRVHHANPGDFLRRNFVDTNGDVSMTVIPFLLAIYRLPLTTPTGQWMAVFLLTAAVVAWPTNQVHQWAHLPRPPRPIRWLQRAGIVLSPEAHRRHHTPPYAEHYCIATGWLNRPLAAICFFRRLERLITAITGLEPRRDDGRFVAAALHGREHA